MMMKYLPAMGPEKAAEIVKGSLASLRIDYDLNIRDKIFEKVFGRRLIFEEYLVSLFIERDIAYKLGGK